MTDSTQNQIEFLRAMENNSKRSELIRSAIGQCADSMEKMRTALESIAANTYCDRCQEAALVARNALDTND